MKVVLRAGIESYGFQLCERRRVEIRHPVYALLFQNVAVLSLFELVQFLFFLAACAWRFPFRLVRLEHVAFVAEFQFHEVTWLCVSYLRCITC